MKQLSAALWPLHHTGSLPFSQNDIVKFLFVAGGGVSLLCLGGGFVFNVSVCVDAFVQGDVNIQASPTKGLLAKNEKSCSTLKNSEPLSALLSGLTPPTTSWTTLVTLLTNHKAHFI